MLYFYSHNKMCGCNTEECSQWKPKTPKGQGHTDKIKQAGRDPPLSQADCVDRLRRANGDEV